jgi:hypothetical protein
MSPSDARYRDGDYDFNFGDDVWKAPQMHKAIARIPVTAEA